MVFKSRKLNVWLISAGAIFVIYLLYNLISKTPPIEIDTGEKFADTVAESDIAEFDGEIGRVGGVGVGTVKKARYAHLNAKKQIDREFGFEKLLHAEGDEWDIEKPFMNIFRNNLKCYMTADEGKVWVEDAVGKPSPTDATLTGNVVIHIVPEKNSKIKEGFIYLDDIIFNSEKSQFSTAGPVKFTSQDAQLFGKGMELVYNEQQDHLEFLKIINLDTLRIRLPSKGSLFSSQESADRSTAASGSRAQVKPQKEKDVLEKEIYEIEKKDGYYKCVLSNNVIIDCPEQLILADEISINNILWSKASDGKSKSGDPGRTVETETPAETARESADSPKEKPVEFSEQFIDIVVTCDSGIALVPMESSETSESTAADDKGIKSFNDEKGRPTFVAKRIDHCLVTENTVASGPSELTFYAKDVIDTKSERKKSQRANVPVKVTAQEKAKFLPVSNQVVFEGDVLCTMLRDEEDFQQKYNLSAPKLTIDLSTDKNSRADIKSLTAKGDVVQLDTSRWIGEKLLGFTKLKCLQFDYDTGRQMFLASGSGIIATDNSRIAEPGKDVGKFSFQRPCYAIVRNFDTLKYFSEENIIIADAASEQILIDYFPIIKGTYGQQTSASANHIEALLHETAGGRNELSKLSAKGGITYEEEGKTREWGKGKDVQFVGSELFYDNSKSMITAWGDESQPCFLNGALAPGIEYDLKTHTVKTKITAPGMMHFEK